MWLALLAGTAWSFDSFDGKAFYLGDLHAHTGASADGGSSDLGECTGACGAIEDAADIAKANGLDFMSLTDHANGSDAASAADFAAVQQVAEAANDPRHGFVTVLGAELWFTLGGVGLGHKNLYVFGGGEEGDGDDDDRGLWSVRDARFAGTDTEIEACSDIDAWMQEVEEEWGPVLLLPHHPGPEAPLGTDWSCHTEEGAAPWGPAVEFYGEHGNSADPETSFDPLWALADPDNTVDAALDPDRWGLRLGFLGGTDRHDTHPGAVCSRDTQHTAHPYGGGLTVVVLDEGDTFDRMAIYDAITARRTYATSGPLVPATLTLLDGETILGEMGEDVALAPGRPLTVELRLPADQVAFVQSAEVVTAGGHTLMEPAGEDTWRREIADLDVPPWLYVEVVLDGAAVYAETGCDDGGDDTDEHLWLSLSWIDRSSTAWPDDTGANGGGSGSTTSARPFTRSEGGCGCAGDGSVGAALLVVPPLVVGRRRRGSGPPASRRQLGPRPACATQPAPAARGAGPGAGGR